MMTTCTIRKVSCICLALMLGLGASAVQAAEKAPIRQESATGITHALLITGSTGTYLFDESSNLIWETPGYSRDGYVLENGNILLSIDDTAREYAQGSQTVLWSYKLSPVNKELGTVYRLENGNTLVVERGSEPRILEVAPDGSIAVAVPLQPDTDNDHMQTRMARKLPNGNYLAPHLLAFKVKEYTPAGKVVREIPTDLPLFGNRDDHSWPFTAILLPNGNIHTNLTHGNRVAEFGPDNEVVWYLDNSHVGGRLSDPCGGQRMPNNNMVICSYAQKDPDMPKVFEVTREKEVVWEFFHPTARAHEVHIITTNGKRVSPIMR